MSAKETELEMVRRHMVVGAGHIVKQQALIDRLKLKSQPTEEAEALLVTFEVNQRHHEGHFIRIHRRVSANGSLPGICG